MTFSGITQRINANNYGVRPLCPCCAGGNRRGGYTHTKATSQRLSTRARKPKYKDHRDGTTIVPVLAHFE
jgi:hypothetical protein